MKKIFLGVITVFIILVLGYYICAFYEKQQRMTLDSKSEELLRSLIQGTSNVEELLMKDKIECTYRNLAEQYQKYTHLIVIDLNAKTMFDVDSNDTSYIHSVNKGAEKISMKASNGAVKTDVVISKEGRFAMIGVGLGSGQKYQWAGWCQ